MHSCRDRRGRRAECGTAQTGRQATHRAPQAPLVCHQKGTGASSACMSRPTKRRMRLREIMAARKLRTKADREIAARRDSADNETAARLVRPLGGGMSVIAFGFVRGPSPLAPASMVIPPWLETTLRMPIPRCGPASRFRIMISQAAATSLISIAPTGTSRKYWVKSACASVAALLSTAGSAPTLARRISSRSEKGMMLLARPPRLSAAETIRSASKFRSTRYGPST